MTFEEALPIVNQAIDRRKNKWTLHSLIYKSWEDIASELRLHVMRKWHLFDPERGKLQAWLDRLICHQIINKLESHYFQSVSPCINCEFNLGDGHCAVWGSYSTECDLYDEYVKSGRADAKNVKFPLSLTASISNEDGHSSLGDFVPAREVLDLEAMSVQFYSQLSGHLTPFENRVYSYVYISGFDDRSAAKFFGYDLAVQNSGQKVGAGTRIIRQVKENIYQKAKIVIKDCF